MAVVILVFVGLSFCFAGLWMALWNFLVPQFGGPGINYWTAFAMVWVLTIVGGFFRGSK